MGNGMITEIVTFALPSDITREEILSKYNATAEKWRLNPDLLHKQYFYNRERHVGGGVYLWKTMEAALKWHDDTYRKMIQDVYGSEPECKYLEGCLVVDNVSGLTFDEPPKP
jgi:hypothetical protein